MEFESVEYDFLCDKAKELFLFFLEGEAITILGEVDNTQSPIEQILYIALNQAISDMHKYYVHTQRKFVLEGKTYIADMAIEIPGTDKYVCVIECDGHDFHERTKEQAKKDRSRDRAFQAIGIPVFRFTGSEIYESPLKCAREIERFLNNLLQR